MNNTDNLVPEPEPTVFDAVNQVLGDEEHAKRVMANPRLAAGFAQGRPMTPEDGTPHDSDMKGELAGTVGPSNVQGAPGGDDIALKAVDDIGRATAQDIKEALHQVIDPELGVDVVDLGLVYGIEIDELGRAIITMTLTTPACPLTDLIEDECASTLAGLVEEFRIDWTWQPRWTIDKVTPEGREQLTALGFNFDNLPTY